MSAEAREAQVNFDMVSYLDLVSCSDKAYQLLLKIACAQLSTTTIKNISKCSAEEGLQDYTTLRF
jgi:hypothetical protein